MSVKLANTAAELSGKHVSVLENDETIESLKTFDRGTDPPFAVVSGAGAVANLDVSLYEGLDRKRAFKWYDLKKDFGAIGDGAANDRAVLNTAFSTLGLAGGGRLFIPAGDYRIAGGTPELDYPNVEIIGEDPYRSTLLFDDEASIGVRIGAAASASTSSLLTVDAAIGDYDITVTSAVGLVVGRNVYLQDNDATHGAFSTKIRAIVGNVVSLIEAMPVALPVASGATLFSYTTDLLNGINIQNLGFHCAGDSSTASKLSLLILTRVRGFRVENCNFNGAVAPLLTTVACRAGLIKKCDFENALTVAGAGMELQTSTKLSVENCEVRNSRFGFTAARSPRTRFINCSQAGFNDVSGGRTLKLSGQANFSTVLGCSFGDTGFTGVRFENVAYCRIEGCDIKDYSAGENGAGGIQFSGTVAQGNYRNVAIGNTIRGGLAQASGIVITGAAELAYHIIKGNNISACKRNAFYCESSYNIIEGNQFGSSDVNEILFINGGGHNIIAGNMFLLEGGVDKPSIYTNTGAGQNTIYGNVLAPATVLATLHATDLVLSPVGAYLGFSTATAVHTGANTTETSAYLKTIKGRTLTLDGHAFRSVSSLSTGATGNNKTFKIKIAGTTTTITINDNQANLQLVVDGIMVAGVVYLSITLHRMVNAGTALQPVVFTNNTGVFDWNTDATFEITMTNGTAVANDCNFFNANIDFPNCNMRTLYQ